MQPAQSSSSAAERLLSPRPGPGVCPRCLNLIESDVGLCRACHGCEHHLAAIVPISYSVGGEWLHRLVASYKRDADPSVPEAADKLASILDSFLATHERCVAAAAGVDRFCLVTSVPSSDPARDEPHPLRRIVGSTATSTAARYERLLRTARSPSAGRRRFDPGRYTAARELHGEPVLLIDDMWTSGSSAQSAAAALRAAGAGPVAAVVIARHLNRGWDLNASRLRSIAARGFSFARCAACDGSDAQELETRSERRADRNPRAFTGGPSGSLTP